MAEEAQSKVAAAEEVVTQDLRVALRAAKDLIESLREYSKNLATDLDEAKDQVNLLKARLHETTKGPEEDKAEQKRKLQAWLKEAASDKEAKMQTAMLAVENRNLKFELEALKTGMPSTPNKKQSGRAAAAPGLATTLLYVLGGAVLGAGITAILTANKN